MTIEEQLRRSNELLENLASYLKRSNPAMDEQSQEEIDEINEAIEKYELEIAELREKLEDEENYRRTSTPFEVDERPIIEGLLEDSLQKERADMREALQKYKKEQSEITDRMAGYSAELEVLRSEVRDIEFRLKKDEIAKRRGIAKKLFLSDSELVQLKEELQSKKELINLGIQVLQFCDDERNELDNKIASVSDTSRLRDKEDRLARIKANKSQSSVSPLDVYAMRLDRDKLVKLESGLQALRNRLEFLTYNPVEKLQNIIEQNGAFLDSTTGPVVGTEFVESSEQPIEDESLDEENLEQRTQLNPVANDAIDAFMSGSPIFNSDGDVVEKGGSTITDEPDDSDSASDENEDENTDENEKISHELIQPELREMEAVDGRDEQPLELIAIDDAPENLKKEKLTDKFKKLWSDWRKRMMAAALAAVLAVGAIVGTLSDKDDEKQDLDSMPPVDEHYSQMQDDVVNSGGIMTPNDNETSTQPEDEQSKEESGLDNSNTTPSTNDSNSSAEETPEAEASKPDKEDASTQVDTNKESDSKPVVTPNTNDSNSSIEEELPEVEAPKTEENTSEQETQTGQLELDGVINNDEIETIVLDSPGEYAEISVGNGEYIYVDYGDTVAPEGVTIKYKGDLMYIYFPVVKSKRM